MGSGIRGAPLPEGGRFLSRGTSRLASVLLAQVPTYLFPLKSCAGLTPKRPERTLMDVSKVPVGGHERPAIRGTGVTEYFTGRADRSALMLAARITLAHFSVSSAISLPNSAGEPAITVPPRSASRALSWGSARAALISLLSLLTISAGVPVGPPTPYQPLDS